jgi:hypothetical protein
MAKARRHFLDEFYKRAARARDQMSWVFRRIISKIARGEHGEVFCQTDSPLAVDTDACFAAYAIALQPQGKYLAISKARFHGSMERSRNQREIWSSFSEGRGGRNREKIAIRVVTCQGRKRARVSIRIPAGPACLCIGDSHTLVYTIFMLEKAGLIDQLAKNLGLCLI